MSAKSLFLFETEHMIMKKFDLELLINDDILFKLYSGSMLDDISTLALWPIHTLVMVMLRNVSGKDDR